jgi:hypothetical protein
MQKAPKHLHPTPLEVNYTRRLNVRAQKKQMVLRRLQEIPLVYFQLQIVFLFILIVCLISGQIAMIVKKTPLYFVCSGFWVSFLLVLSLVNIHFLGEYIRFQYLKF